MQRGQRKIPKFVFHSVESVQRSHSSLWPTRYSSTSLEIQNGRIWTRAQGENTAGDTGEGDGDRCAVLERSVTLSRGVRQRCNVVRATPINFRAAVGNVLNIV